MQCRTRKRLRTHKQWQCNHNLRLTLRVNRWLQKYQTLNQQKISRRWLWAKLKQAREEQKNIPWLRLVSLLQIISARRARKRNFKSEPWGRGDSWYKHRCESRHNKCSHHYSMAQCCQRFRFNDWHLLQTRRDKKDFPRRGSHRLPCVTLAASSWAWPTKWKTTKHMFKCLCWPCPAAFIFLLFETSIVTLWSSCAPKHVM